MVKTAESTGAGQDAGSHLLPLLTRRLTAASNLTKDEQIATTSGEETPANYQRGFCKLYI